MEMGWSDVRNCKGVIFTGVWTRNGTADAARTEKEFPKKEIGLGKGVCGFLKPAGSDRLVFVGRRGCSEAGVGRSVYLDGRKQLFWGRERNSMRMDGFRVIGRILPSIPAQRRSILLWVLSGVDRVDLNRTGIEEKREIKGKYRERW